MSKQQIDQPINATPSKRIYRSIIADYDLQTALAELVDNVIDSVLRTKIKKTATIDINLDFDQQSITVSDNAGGISVDNLPKLIKPGASDNDGSRDSIGIFGIGSKRAAVALAADIRIETRYNNDKQSYLVEYDDAWLEDDDNWDLNYFKISDISVGSTKVRLSMLRFKIFEKDEKIIRDHFGRLYAKFLSSKTIAINVNGAPVQPVYYDQWSYPPGYEPRLFEKRLVVPGKTLPFLFKITSGITWEQGSINGNYGVYVYCNNRMVIAASKLSAFGFHTGVAGVPHPRMSNARVIVELTGSAADMPWTSNKSGLNFNHQIMRFIEEDIHAAVKNATSLSKRLQPEFENSILPHKTGSIICNKLKKDEHLKPSKLPCIPVTKKSVRDSVVELNKSLVLEKLHTEGVVDSVVAVQLLKEKTKLQFKNRIILIILDSCLEIAFKDYLVCETPNSIAEARLQSFSRIQLEQEVRNFIFTNDQTLWKKVQYFYKLRCDLTHKRSSATINDKQLLEFEKLSQKLFKKMFGMKFPAL